MFAVYLMVPEVTDNPGKLIGVSGLWPDAKADLCNRLISNPAHFWTPPPNQADQPHLQQNPLCRAHLGAYFKEQSSRPLHTA